VIFIDNTEFYSLSKYHNNLAAEALFIGEKNRIVDEIKELCSQLQKKYNVSKEDADKFNKLVESYFNQEKDWHITKEHFESIHKGFFANLKNVSSSLTSNDLKHCAYIKLGFDTKEISRIMGIEPHSIQKARVRLKKKLNLSKDDDLYVFIMNL